MADLVLHQDKQASAARRPVEDLVVVAEFRDPVFPGLVSTGKVERRGDRPFHTVINAENFHALQVLLYTVCFGESFPRQRRPGRCQTMASRALRRSK